jgi:NAD(P)-dependent dehydrogenase (short-subunit alcohol dehydrogenase family)
MTVQCRYGDRRRPCGFGRMVTDERPGTLEEKWLCSTGEKSMTRWTAANIPPLNGKIAIVTGANSGLGFQTARQLARHGARVILACRDLNKGTEAARQIQELAPGATLEVAELDLASLASVRRFAADFAGGHDGLDILVNNAGVMAIPHRRSAEGFELQLATNHLGHFALTGLLMPCLLARPGARVVSVSSMAALLGRIRFSDLQSQQRYNNWMAYGQSKLANLLFIFELDRRVRARRLPLIAAAAHPGYANTNLQAVGPRMTGNTWVLRLSEWAAQMLAQPAHRGALPQLYAATAPGVRGGEYFGPDGFLGQSGYPRRVKAPRAAYDVTTARRLWEVSSELTGVRYEALESPQGDSSEQVRVASEQAAR